MNIALIVAAGTGSRMQGIEVPKQFLIVEDKPLFVYSAETFQNHQDIDAIVIVTLGEYIEQVKKWCNDYNLTKVKAVISGGQTRRASVYYGIKEIKKIAVKSPDTIVLIHDAARPLVTSQIITNNIVLCKQYRAVITAIPASDTIFKSKDGDIISGSLNRSELYQAQTPQTFDLYTIDEAHFMAMTDGVPDDITDDARLVMYFGMNVYFTNGSKYNFKITTNEDLEIFKTIIKNK